MSVSNGQRAILLDTDDATSVNYVDSRSDTVTLRVSVRVPSSSPGGEFYITAPFIAGRRTFSLGSGENKFFDIPAQFGEGGELVLFSSDGTRLDSKTYTIQLRGGGGSSDGGSTSGGGGSGSSLGLPVVLEGRDRIIRWADENLDQLSQVNRDAALRLGALVAPRNSDVVKVRVSRTGVEVLERRAEVTESNISVVSCGVNNGRDVSPGAQISVRTEVRNDNAAAADVTVRWLLGGESVGPRTQTIAANSTATYATTITLNQTFLTRIGYPGTQRFTVTAEAVLQ